ncbi:hypothetical protein HERIO_222 [Hepatospora eriocheir]|uniref:Uncharacterized protein n=1 Tax=Hepatospora eriocheir TaxID=1081669 RepID=A0A1X0QDU6_9MICR|nr:hypothetical protein HERIO_222 [Hepatospora eriocheir]
MYVISFHYLKKLLLLILTKICLSIAYKITTFLYLLRLTTLYGTRNLSNNLEVPVFLTKNISYALILEFLFLL